MTHSRHTQRLPAVPEETAAYGWTPRPDPPRRKVFPRGWQDAAQAAWMCAGFALAFLCAAGGIDLLRVAMGK